MDETFDLVLVQNMERRLRQELLACNEISGRYGLCLSEIQIAAITQRRLEALAAAGRVEFGRGILQQLVVAFCDCPYIDSTTYEETLSELLDAFYYFKNESEDRISDDDLIGIMRHHFDNVCHGSMEYMCGTTLEDLCRNTRYGYETDDEGPMF